MAVEARGRVVGSGGWRPRVRAQAGDVVEYRISLFNAGFSQLTDVRVKSRLSPGMELVGASARLKNLGVDEANAHPLPAGLTQGNGVRLGPFSSRGAREVHFRTRLMPRARGLVRNRVTVTTSAGRHVAVVPVRVSAAS